MIVGGSVHSRTSFRVFPALNLSHETKQLMRSNITHILHFLVIGLHLETRRTVGLTLLDKRLIRQADVVLKAIRLFWK
jgi:hypothetical protein